MIKVTLDNGLFARAESEGDPITLGMDAFMVANALASEIEKKGDQHSYKAFLVATVKSYMRRLDEVGVDYTSFVKEMNEEKEKKDV